MKSGYIATGKLCIAAVSNPDYSYEPSSGYILGDSVHIGWYKIQYDYSIDTYNFYLPECFSIYIKFDTYKIDALSYDEMRLDVRCVGLYYIYCIPDINVQYSPCYCYNTDSPTTVCIVCCDINLSSEYSSWKLISSGIRMTNYLFFCTNVNVPLKCITVSRISGGSTNIGWINGCTMKLV